MSINQSLSETKSAKPKPFAFYYGYALNLRFDPNTVAGERGKNLLSSLVAGFFESGGMELQFNILDPEQLQDARKHPGRYPDLVVRVAGYCAYFDDLPDKAKMEIISRTRLLCSSFN